MASQHQTWVKLDTIRNKAFLSDTIFYLDSYPHYIRKGFNVLYGDGAVRFWQDKNRYFEDIAKRQPYISAGQVYEVFDMFDKN